jgi:hypothetical protein
VRVAEGGEVEEFPRADPKASDPSEVAEARELVRVPRRAHKPASAAELTRTLPSPSEVADRVTALRAAMFGAVSESDVADVMRAVVDRAKGGSTRDAKLLLDLLAPARSGVTVHQQAVVIQQGDVG